MGKDSSRMRDQETRLKIGISACFLHPDPARTAFAKKTLQYIEQSMAHWIMASGALPVMIPSPAGETARGEVHFDDYSQWLDGLVLHGGANTSTPVIKVGLPTQRTRKILHSGLDIDMTDVPVTPYRNLPSCPTRSNWDHSRAT